VRQTAIAIFYFLIPAGQKSSKSCCKGNSSKSASQLTFPGLAIDFYFALVSLTIKLIKTVSEALFNIFPTTSLCLNYTYEKNVEKNLPKCLFVQIGLFHYKKMYL